MLGPTRYWPRWAVDSAYPSSASALSRRLTLLFFKPNSPAISVTPSGERSERISRIRNAFSIERNGFGGLPATTASALGVVLLMRPRLDAPIPDNPLPRGGMANSGRDASALA